MYDFLIRNALILDGTGKAGIVGDIGIAAGKIAGLGHLDPDSRHTIDGAGLIAAPGFIDMHSHSDAQYLQDQSPVEKIQQGITTELIGQDGLGIAPVRPDRVALLSELTAGLQGTLDRDRWSWGTFDEYLQALERRGLPNNAAGLVSHAPLRIQAMNMEARPASPAEIEIMRALLCEAMDQGAFGLSTGLIYPPCSYSTTGELIELNRTVAEKGGVFVVHQRDEGYRLLESMAELMQVARTTNVRLHISHLQAIGKVSWPFIDDVLAMADQLLAEGGIISWDRYPYLAGCTVLSAVLPAWVLADDPKVLVENLKDPAYRARVRAEFQKGLDVWSNRSVLLGWSKVQISAVESQKNRWMVGQDIETLAKTCEKDPVDLICDLLIEENMAVKMISFYGSELVLQKIMQHPRAAVGTDGIPGGKPHPRLYGTFPRFIEKFVKQDQLFTLPEAIRKITSLPAEILGLAGRGILLPGYWADMVLLELDQVADLATYADPEQPPKGIEYVFVNGEPVIKRGKATGSLPGRVLRKGRAG